MMVYFRDMLVEGQNIDGLQKNLDNFSELVREAVLLLWDNWTVTQPAAYAEKKKYPSVVQLLARHICECLDSVSIVAAQGAAEPCKLPIRSAIEATLLINYILESDCERRGLAYEVGHIHKEFDTFDKLDPVKQTQFAARIARLRALLTQPEYVEIEAAWQKKRRYQSWTSLFNGPSSVKKLAQLANRPELYDYFYSYFSSAMHAADGFEKIGLGDSSTGQHIIKPLRHPDQLQSMVVTSVRLCAIAGKMVLDRWGTDEQKAKAQAVHEARIQPDLMNLQRGEMISAPWK